MASWADASPIQFTPYIQQLPVEAMVATGTELQRRYDVGVEKIQSAIDNIAGLDIIKDADKAYLHSKLNELGTTLKSVAAGDFSNHQLVNSVTGLVGKVGKDKNVQNAVYSTAYIKKQRDILEKDRVDGKLSPSNEYRFNKGLSSYLNDGKVGSLFNDNYIPYFDIDKHVKEVFDGIKPDGYSTSQIFQTDNNGNLLYQSTYNKKTGKTVQTPILSTTMTELKQKGIFPPKVAETLDHIFDDPRVQQQLQIDGEYNYRSHTPEMLLQNVTSSYRNETFVYDNKIKDLQIKKSSTSDIEEQQAIQLEIDAVNAKKGVATSTLQSLVKGIETNPDAIRGILHMNDTRANFMAMYTNVDTESLIKENPAWRAEFDMQKEANDLMYKEDTRRYQWASLKQAHDHFMMQLKADALNKPNEGTEKIPTEYPNTTSFDLVLSWEDKGKMAAQQMSSAVDDLLFSSGLLGGVESYMKDHPNLSVDEARDELIRNTAAANGETPEQFRTRWYNKAKSQYNQNPQKLTPPMRAKLISAENAERTYSNFMNEKKKIDDVAPFPELAKDLKTIVLPVQAVQALNIGRRTSISGIVAKELTLTPQMQYDIALAYAGDDIFESTEMRRRARDAQKRLETQGISKDDINVIAESYKGIRTKHTLTGTNSEEVLSFASLIRNIDNIENQETFERRAEAIRTFYQVNPELGVGFMTSDDKPIKGAMSQMTNIINSYVRAQQNESANFVTNAPKMKEILSGNKKGDINIRASKNEVTGQIVPVAIFSDETGNTIGEMTMSIDQAKSLGVDVSEWWASPKVKEVKQLMEVVGNGTTAYGPLNSYSTYTSEIAPFTKEDFPNLRKIPQDVKGHIEKVIMTDAGGTQYPVYYNYLYINDNGTPYVKIFDTPLSSMSNAVDAFSNITPDFITTIIAEKQNNKK